MFKLCAFTLFVLITTNVFCASCKLDMKKVAIFVNHKKTPPSVINALQMASINHTPENVVCLFFNTEAVLQNPEKFRPILADCEAWVGPVHSQETKDLLATLDLPATPTFLSFSNNLALLNDNVFPLGPSPLLELFHVFEDMKNQCLSRVLVLISETSLDKVLPFFLASNLNVNFLFFVYSKEVSSEVKDELARALKIFSPDAIIAPFGDTASFEYLLESIGATSAYTNMMPYIAGTSLWGKEFLSDTALLKAFKVQYPQTQKLLAFQKDFQKNFQDTPSKLAITAFDTLCVALEIVSNPEKKQFQTCRGNITLLQPFLGYEVK